MIDGSAPTDPATRPAAGRRRAPRAPRTRWLAAAGASGLAVVLALSLALRSGAAPACAAAPRAAAPPVGGAVHKGKATFYDSKGAGGNCSYPAAPANRLYVALGPDEYAAGAACGGHLDVTGPRGTVRVLVMDQCPECATGHLDLSREAFARIADPVQGIVSVSYRAVVDPPLPGPLTFRMKEGSSQYWFAVLVGDHGNPLRSVEVRPSGSTTFRSATRQDYNYWLIESGAGPGPYTVRVTDVYGHRATATGIRMAPGRTQRSTVRMYGGGSAAPGTDRTGTPTRSPSARPSPSRSASPRPTTSPTGSATPASPGAAVAPAAEGTRAPGCS
ncbi:expansin EXLX1 family cellulose-binding protein [Micromonospora coxensis]|uniref:Peptidoglycan-binding domain-containing protein, expansin n=1 Tax=Micromonospora coxensis TaxID=356852 RepID=A0A1C5JDN8_9ACTN|nr:expansin EXLX1 family cellulose-binding protein [Micromonospora coxensis]SCG68687.1 Peptidoglycan-binding domain-containing protein, expansin [Micromonospora coxensis]